MDIHNTSMVIHTSEIWISIMHLWISSIELSISISGLRISMIILSTPVPFVPWQSGLPFPIYSLTLKIKGQCQRCPCQRSIQLTHFLSISHQGILSTPVPFVPWQSGLPWDTNWPWKFKVNVKGTLVSVTFSWLINFCFPPTIPKIWQIECSTGEKRIWNFTKKIAKKNFWHNCPKI